MGEGGGVDEVVGLGEERAVQGDDVGLGEEGFQGGVFAEVFVEERFGLVDVVCEDATPEAVHDAGEAYADAACADDADGFGVQGLAEEAVESEIALADAVVGAVGFAVEGLDQGDGEFGDGFGGVRGDVGEEEAEGFGGGEVDVVEAGAAEEDGADTECVELLEDRGGEDVVHEDADCGVVGGELDGGGGERGGVVGNGEWWIVGIGGREVGEEEALIVGLGGEDGKRVL